MFVLGKPFQPSLMFMVTTRALVKHLSDAPLQALPANIKLGWKGLPGTNTLAYYESSQITDVKSFYNIRPRNGSIHTIFHDSLSIIFKVGVH